MPITIYYSADLITLRYAYKVVVFFYCRAKTNTQIANSANIRRHDLARREEAKDQNKNAASSSDMVAESAPPLNLALRTA